MKRTVLSCLPLVPVIAHWLLPSGLETDMYIIVGGVVPFFIFNACYFIYIFSYRRLVDETVELVPYQVRISTIIFITTYLLYSFVHGVLNGIDDILVLMTNNQVLVYSLFLFILHPMDDDMIERTKYIIIPVSILLSLEVLLFSLGILEYSVDLHAEIYGGVKRISTTVDAATGTAIVFVMMGVILLHYSDIKPYFRIGVLILITVSILLLQSIGSILVWGLYISYYIYSNYLKNQTFKFKIKSLILFSMFFFCLYKIDVFNPILERYNELDENDRIGTGRGEIVERALNIFMESGGFGIGLGQTNYDKSLRIIHLNRSYPVGVHNYYICILTELGFWGICFLLMYLLSLIKYLNFNYSLSLYILLLFSITFCLEPIFLCSEFTCFAVFMLMVSVQKTNNVILYDTNDNCYSEEI